MNRFLRLFALVFVAVVVSGCSSTDEVNSDRESPETAEVSDNVVVQPEPVAATEDIADEPADDSDTSRTFVAGVHYNELEAPLPSSMNADLTNFFYFGCPSCYQLNPALAQWRAETGATIELVPVHSEEKLVEGAMIFHTFVEMGVLAQMYEWGYVMFMQEDTEKFGWERVNEFLGDKKISRPIFWETMDSDAVRRRLGYSLRMNKHANVSITPTFVVHGRYVVNTDAVSSLDEFFALLSYLVEDKRPAQVSG